MFLVSVVHFTHRSIFKIIAGLSLFTKVTLILWVNLVTLLMRGTPELRKGFIFAASILGLRQLFISKGLRYLGIILLQNFTYSFTWVLALYIACSCKVNKFMIQLYQVVLCCLNLCRSAERHLQALWTAVPHLVQVWNKAGLPRPFTEVTCLLCLQETKDRWTISYCTWESSSTSPQPGGSSEVCF